jgi:glycosyltransferase involved in cell wall biosynthesis
MKLNWFSPLPPAATDIAHYTSRVLPALCQLAEVTLWTTSRQWSKSLESFATVRRYGLDRLPWTELNRSDMTFYHIGNNPRFHWPIWHVSRVNPGVIVLHDQRLHHFFDGVYRLQYQNLDMYLETMERQYGPSALSDARECFTTNGRNIDYMARCYPLTEFAVENSLGALVHTREAFEALKPRPDWPVMYAPLPFPSHEQSSKPKAGPPYRIVLFGYLGRNRRLDSIFTALARMAEKDQFRLDIFGSILDDEQSIQTKIRVLKLTNLVTLHGFVPEERLEEALASAHLAINLRFPTVGEASGSQLRIWSHALPSLVSNVGWYASLPSDGVAHVRTDENEVGDIQDHLRAFLQNPAAFARMGLKGLEELKRRHSPEAYATSAIEIASRAGEQRSQRAAQALARRAGAPLAGWLDKTDFDEPLQRVVGEALSLVKASS